MLASSPTQFHYELVNSEDIMIKNGKYKGNIRRRNRRNGYNDIKELENISKNLMEKRARLKVISLKKAAGSTNIGEDIYRNKLISSVDKLELKMSRARIRKEDMMSLLNVANTTPKAGSSRKFASQGGKRQGGMGVYPLGNSIKRWGN